MITTAKSRLMRLNPQFVVLVVALLSLTVVLIFLTYLSLKNQLMDTVADQSKVIAHNIAPALQFQDEQAAQSILNSLRSNRSVAAAMLLNQEQNIYVFWHEERDETAHIKDSLLTQWLDQKNLQAAIAQDAFSDRVIQQPIVVNEQTLGQLVILVSYKPMYTRLLTNGMMTVLAVLIALTSAFFILRRVQRALIESQEALYLQANFDALTHLPNRYAFMNDLTQTIHKFKHSQKSFQLLFIDLDNFKVVNDSYGHSMGDKLLVAVTQRLKSVLPSSWQLYRLGSDEFMVVTHPGKQPIATVLEPAKALKNAMKAPFGIHTHEFFVEVSIGISQFPQHGREAEALLRSADTALHAGKSEQRGKIKVFSEVLTEKTQLKFNTENALRHALELNELVLHYQPQVSLASGRVTGVEALMRWQRGTQLVYPNDFIPLAEENGLIVSMGEWALYEGCRVRKQWLDAGIEDMVMAINLSARQITEIDLPGLVKTVLQQTGLPAHLLELEITESMLMCDLNMVVMDLQKLRQMGVKIAIDDFGTGYSSIAYLKQLPIDLLKIDRSFVKDIDHDESDRSIIKTILQLAQNLGINTLAEGVECDAHLEFLLQHGCGRGQGYVYSKPIPEKQALEWILAKQSQ